MQGLPVENTTVALARELTTKDLKSIHADTTSQDYCMQFVIGSERYLQLFPSIKADPPSSLVLNTL